MKLSVKHNIFTIFSGLFLLVMILGINSCSTEAPFGPENNHTETVTTQENNASFNYLTWNSSSRDGVRSLNKTHSASAYIRRSKGGQLEIEARDKGSDVALYASFVVSRNSIDHSKAISMSIDDEVVEFEFGPSGTTFEPFAKLNFKITGVDLSKVDLSGIGFYYLRPDGGKEAVSNDGIIVDVESGTIVVRNAQICHFSRYALGKD